MSDTECEVHSADAGSAKYEPRQASALRKNGHVLIKDRPCKIVEMSTSKTGKHGSAKIHMVAIDIFSQKKYEDITPSTATMNVPIVVRREYQLVNIEDDFLSLMDDDGSIRDDIKMPTDEKLAKDIKNYFDANDQTILVSVLSAMGEDAAVSVKTASDNK